MKLRNDPVMNGARARAREWSEHCILGRFWPAEDGTGAARRLHFADQESDSDIVHHEAVRGRGFEVMKEYRAGGVGFRAVVLRATLRPGSSPAPPRRDRSAPPARPGPAARPARSIPPTPWRGRSRARARRPA